MSTYLDADLRGAEAKTANKPPSPPPTTGCESLYGSRQHRRTRWPAPTCWLAAPPNSLSHAHDAGRQVRQSHTTQANKLAATPRLWVSSDSLVGKAGAATVDVMQELELGVPAAYPALPSHAPAATIYKTTFCPTI
jgi:hypothetical protein